MQTSKHLLYKLFAVINLILLFSLIHCQSKALQTVFHTQRLIWTTFGKQLHIFSIKIMYPPTNKYYQNTLYTCFTDAVLDFLPDLRHDIC